MYMLMLTGSYKVAPPVPAKPKYMQSATSRGGAPPLPHPTSLASHGAAPSSHPQFNSVNHAYYGADPASSAPGSPHVGGAYPVGGASTMENVPSSNSIGGESRLPDLISNLKYSIAKKTFL